MSASNVVDIKITAQDMASPAFQDLAENLKMSGTAAESASQQLSASGKSASSAGSGFRTAAAEIESMQAPVAASRSGLTALGGSFHEMAAMTASFTIANALMELPHALKDAADAAGEDSASQARLQKAVEDTGVSFSTYSNEIDEAVKHGRDLAFGNDQTRQALSLLAAETGSTEEALHRLSAAQDLSRGTGMDLVTASRLLGKVSDDNVTALQRYGVVVKKGSDAQALLNAVDQKFGGQAGVYAASEAGAMARASIAVHELEVALGRDLAPALTSSVSGITGFVDAVTHLADSSGTAQASFKLMGAAAGGIVVLGLLAASRAAIGTTASFIGLDAAAAPWIAGAAAIGIAGYGLVKMYENLTAGTDAHTQAMYRELDVYNAAHPALSTVEKVTGSVTDKTVLMNSGLRNLLPTVQETTQAADHLALAYENAATSSRHMADTTRDLNKANTDWMKVFQAEDALTAGLAKVKTAYDSVSPAVWEYNAATNAAKAADKERATAAAEAIGAMDAEAQAGQRLNASLAGLNDSSYHLTNIQTELASAYQTGLTSISAYTSQASEYGGEADDIQKALDIWKQRLDAGEISQDTYNQKVAAGTDAIARLKGGQDDAIVTAGDYAIANGELMKAQDAVNKQYPDLVAGSSDYNKQLKDAFINAGGTAAQFDQLQASGAGLQGAISGPGGLTEAINNLITALETAGGEHPTPTVDLKITGKDELDSIAAQLQALDGHTYTSNYTLDVGITGSGGGGQNPGGGGTIQAPPDTSGGGGGGGVGPNAQSRTIQSIGDAYGAPVITPAMLSSARGNVQNAQSYADEIKALVQALADAAAEEGDAVDAAKTYADAAKSVLDVFTAAIALDQAMGDTVFQYGDWQATNIANLKALTEKATQSMIDAAALVSGDQVTAAKAYADAAKASLDALEGALKLSQDMGDTVIQYGDWQATNEANLKFIAEKAVQSIGDSAAIMSGPYLDGVKAYADAVHASIGAEEDALGLVQKLADDTALSGVNMRTVAMNARELAGDARFAADAFQLASAGWADDADPAMQALASDVGNTVSAMSSTLDLLDKMAGFQPPSAADIGAFATEVAADTVLFVQDLQTAAKDMDTNAVTAAGQWADGAGKVLGLMGTTADALTKINAVGQITKAQMSIFQNDVEQVFQLIPTLWNDVQPFITDASQLQPVLEQIAADMQAAQSAVNGLNVGSGGGGGGGSGSGGGGASGGGSGGFYPGEASLGHKSGALYGQQIGGLGTGGKGYGGPGVGNGAGGSTSSGPGQTYHNPQPVHIHVHMDIAQHEFEQVVTTTLDGIDGRRF